MRSAVSNRRSCNCGCMPSAIPRSISTLLAARISALRDSISSAIALSAAARSAPVATVSVRAAARAKSANAATVVVALMA